MKEMGKMKSEGVKKGAWTKEEDDLLRKCIDKFGEGKWHRVPLRSGLNRCRQSCRLRWLNYLKPNLKRGHFTKDEVDLILRLHKLLGNRWSLIAGRLPGRTANDVKNFWNTHISKKSRNCATATKQSNIIRPRPRTFNFSKSRLLPPATINHQPPHQSSTSHHVLQEDWWTTLLLTTKNLQPTSPGIHDNNLDAWIL